MPMITSTSTTTTAMTIQVVIFTPSRATDVSTYTTTRRGRKPSLWSPVRVSSAYPMGPGDGLSPLAPAVTPTRLWTRILARSHSAAGAELSVPVRSTAEAARPRATETTAAATTSYVDSVILRGGGVKRAQPAAFVPLTMSARRAAGPGASLFLRRRRASPRPRITSRAVVPSCRCRHGLRPRRRHLIRSRWSPPPLPRRAWRAWLAAGSPSSGTAPECRRRLSPRPE